MMVGEIRRLPSTIAYVVVPWSGRPPAEAEEVASRVLGSDPSMTDLSSGRWLRREDGARGGSSRVEKGGGRGREEGGEELGCRKRTISQECNTGGRRHKMHTVMQQLPETLQCVFILHFADGERMGWPLETV
jgi:hypothetical protein